MSSGGNGMQGAAGENLYEASILYFKAPVSSYNSVGFTAGAVRNFETDRSNNGVALMPCMIKMGGGRANPMLRIYENGRSKSAEGDEMNFGEEDIIGLGISAAGVVSFYKNGRKFRECSQGLEFPVHVDAVFNTRSYLTFLGLMPFEEDNLEIKTGVVSVNVEPESDQPSEEEASDSPDLEIETGVVSWDIEPEAPQMEPPQAIRRSLELDTGVTSVEIPPETKGPIEPVSKTSSSTTRKEESLDTCKDAENQRDEEDNQDQDLHEKNA